jgi:hypothetical protein
VLQTGQNCFSSHWVVDANTAKHVHKPASQQTSTRSSRTLIYNSCTSALAGPSAISCAQQVPTGSQRMWKHHGKTESITLATRVAARNYHTLCSSKLYVVWKQAWEEIGFVCTSTEQNSINLIKTGWLGYVAHTEISTSPYTHTHTHTHTHKTFNGRELA